jgi:hypothetical protein
MSNHRSSVGTLLDMLTYCRPAGSKAESEFIDRFLAPLGGTFDPHRNYHVTIGDSPILWSCHTDTVHQWPGRQTLHYDAVADMIYLSKRSKRSSRCLGADDTAGVFLCHQMIRAGIAGHYIFHFGEETGGHGSSDLAKLSPTLISDSRFAIALDRRGCSDIITHQAWSRCCSDAFAVSLAAELSRGCEYLDLTPSDNGIFTDTANYTAIIGECTNLSVGYDYPHTPDERLDVTFLDELFGALCRLDSSTLVSERTPADDDYEWATNYTNNWRYFGTPVRRHSSLSRITKPEILFTEDCNWCGLAYDPEESTATDNLQYCSDACEYDAHDFLASDSHQSVYLDPQYEDVQKALRRVRA